MKRYETDCGGCRVAVNTKPKAKPRKRVKFTKASYGRMLKLKAA